MTLNADIGDCTVAEVMGTELFTLTPETSVTSACRLVDVSGSSHLIVIEDGALAGIVCDDDLRAADRDACVADCMTSPVLCISADTTLQEAVDIMSDNDVDCLPVVTGLLLVGMVTRDALALAEQSVVEGPCAGCSPAAHEARNDNHQDDDQGDDSDLTFCDRCQRSMAAAGRC
jgi:CBS domain-containing protein